MYMMTLDTYSTGLTRKPYSPVALSKCLSLLLPSGFPPLLSLSLISTVCILFISAFVLSRSCLFAFWAPLLSLPLPPALLFAIFL